MNAIAELKDQADRSLLIVEDDKPFLERLSRAMETRGFTVTSCDTVSDGMAQIGRAAPAFAVVDLRLGDGNGLDVVVGAEAQASGGARDRADRLRQHRHRGDGGEDGRGGLSLKTRRCRRCRRCLARQRHRKVRAAATIRCRPTGCAGNTSSASTKCATATFPKRRGGSTCTAAPCSASWPSARRGSAFFLPEAQFLLVVPAKAGTTKVATVIASAAEQFGRSHSGMREAQTRNIEKFRVCASHRPGMTIFDAHPRSRRSSARDFRRSDSVTFVVGRQHAFPTALARY